MILPGLSQSPRSTRNGAETRRTVFWNIAYSGYEIHELTFSCMPVVRSVQR